MYIFLNISTTEIFIQFFFLFLLYFKMSPLGSTWIWSEMKICTYRIYICTVVYGWLLATNCDVVSKISTSIRQEICLQAYREREGVGVLLIRLGGLMGGGSVHFQCPLHLRSRRRKRRYPKCLLWSIYSPSRVYLTIKIYCWIIFRSPYLETYLLALRIYLIPGEKL